MNCIKYSLFAAVLALLLSGCESMGGKKTQGVSEEDLNTIVTDDGIALVRIARPEPENKPSIPGPAKKEWAAAKVAMEAQDWQDAEQRLQTMTANYPELAGPYVNLGIVLSKQEKLDEAEQAYRQALVLNAYNFDAYSNLGLLLREQGRFSDAEAVYLEALRLWPHHQASLLNIGVLYDMYMGKLAEALSYFKTAQKLNDEEDRQLKGWIIDLQRRVEAEQ